MMADMMAAVLYGREDLRLERVAIHELVAREDGPVGPLGRSA